MQMFPLLSPHCTVKQIIWKAGTSSLWSIGIRSLNVVSFSYLMLNKIVFSDSINDARFPLAMSPGDDCNDLISFINRRDICDVRFVWAISLTDYGDFISLINLGDIHDLRFDERYHSDDGDLIWHFNDTCDVRYWRVMSPSNFDLKFWLPLTGHIRFKHVKSRLN